MLFKFFPNGEVEIYEKNILLGKGTVKDSKVENGYNSVIVESILDDFYVNSAVAVLPTKKDKQD